MNRLVLIGNGFDLAHGLKTSYKDFVEWYWEKRIQSLAECETRESKDALCTFVLNSQHDTWQSIMSQKGMNNKAPKNIEILKERLAHQFINLNYSTLFESINRSIDTKKWVDIENEYYRFLSSWKYPHPLKSPKELNEELDSIKKLLAEYLLDVQNNTLPKFKINENIKSAMFAPIKPCEISVGAKNILNDLVNTRLIDENYDWEYLWRKWDKTFSSLDASTMFNIKQIYDEQKLYANIDILLNKQIPANFLLPDNMMILNFNYTEIADQYVKNTDFEVNHIHGELNVEDNMIFGYGDELDENYKKIQNLNDNEYLKNSKSVRYLEADNYRKMLTFIESEPYQIFIMGHSCGNSDRTLLNTLFEHKNCVSIKPFYYKKDDNTDTYLEIVQNISRNFTDMKLMRDRVVNKEYCEELPQVKDMKP